VKILHICRNLCGSRVFPELFVELERQGLEQVVFAPEISLPPEGPPPMPGVQTYLCRTLRNTDTLFFFRKAQRTVPEVLGRVRMKEVRLIHAHTLFTDGSIARSLSRKTGLPYMVTLRYSDVAAIYRYEPHLRPLARRILRDAVRVVFLSEGIRREVTGWLPREEQEAFGEKTAVIPNGIAPAWLDGTPRKLSGEVVRVGFAGKLNDRKRPLDALRAVHAANAGGSRRFVLRVCGTGPLEGRVRQALGKEDEMLGKITGMEPMKAFYRSCDVLLVPSRAETFGMVYLEAMSQGVPVLYTRGQGFDGQFPDGQVGYPVICRNISSQADALHRIAGEDYEAMSSRCLEAAGSLSLPRVAGMWMQLYGD